MNEIQKTDLVIQIGALITITREPQDNEDRLAVNALSDLHANVVKHFDQNGAEANAAFETWLVYNIEQVLDLMGAPVVDGCIQ